MLGFLIIKHRHWVLKLVGLGLRFQDWGLSWSYLLGLRVCSMKITGMGIGDC